jgi:vanillate O-demethylase ferredoxin subunit
MTSACSPTTAEKHLKVRLASISYEAQGINAYELKPLDGGALPPFTAGAHIDLHLPSGHTRSYSLVNAPHERHRYVVAVSRAPDSRGGSRYMHDEARVGEVFTIGAPRNNFALAEDAPHSLFIAGGIGITPLWSMIQRLERLGRSWELYYCARTAQHAAFLDLLRQTQRAGQGGLHLNFDGEPGGSPLDLAAVVRAARPDAHLYCCGPGGMLAAFEAACCGRPPEQVHVEYFAGTTAPATESGFTVVLAKSGRTFEVPAGETILSVLLAAGVGVAHSCREGVCGSCETRVIAGTPDHRDHVLSGAEKVSGKTMMICCSGSACGELVLDL